MIFNLPSAVQSPPHYISARSQERPYDYKKIKFTGDPGMTCGTNGEVQQIVASGKAAEAGVQFKGSAMPADAKKRYTPTSLILYLFGNGTKREANGATRLSKGSQRATKMHPKIDVRKRSWKMSLGGGGLARISLGQLFCPFPNEKCDKKSMPNENKKFHENSTKSIPKIGVDIDIQFI